MISKKILDKRICDIEGGDNDQTYREFIRESEKEFGLPSEPIDKYPDNELHRYVEELDYLWGK